MTAYDDLSEDARNLMAGFSETDIAEIAVQAKTEVTRLRAALHHQAAQALRQAADHINALPQDYELDPGRGECADLLRTMADQTAGAAS